MTPNEMSSLTLLTRIYYTRNGFVPTNVVSKYRYLLDRLDTKHEVGEVLLGLKTIEEVSEATFNTVFGLLNWAKRNTR